MQELDTQDAEVNHQDKATKDSMLERAYRTISNFAIPQNIVQSNNATRPQQLQDQLKVLGICALVSICVKTCL